MAEGFLFIWIGWIIWIVITFFMEKNKLRLFLGVWILLILALANIQIQIFSFNISLIFLVLLIGAIVFYNQLFFQKRYLIYPFTIMICFTGNLLIQHEMNNWLMLPSEIIIPIQCSIIISLLVSGFYERIICSVIGICLGEMLYSFILNSYSLIKQIGDLLFFDLTFIMISLIIFITFLQEVKISQFGHSRSVKKPNSI